MCLAQSINARHAKNSSGILSNSAVALGAPQLVLDVHFLHVKQRIEGHQHTWLFVSWFKNS
jgi:hypothetical protein